MSWSLVGMNASSPFANVLSSSFTEAIDTRMLLSHFTNILELTKVSLVDTNLRMSSYFISKTDYYSDSFLSNHPYIFFFDWHLKLTEPVL